MCAAQMAERHIHPYYILSVLAHPVQIGAGFHPRVFQLLLFGQLGKGNLSLHELALRAVAWGSTRALNNASLLEK